MKKLLVLVLAFGLVQCSTFDESDTLPAFLNFETATVNPTADQGAETNKITDAWVIAEGQDLGVFPLPAIAPVLFEQTTSTLDIFAGVRKNGVLNDAIIYPFYNRVQLDKSLTPGENCDIPLDFTYDDATNFRFTEGFESGIGEFSFDQDGDGDLNFVVASEDPGMGTQSGLIEITERDKIVEIGTETLYQLPIIGGGPIFLEMDYKSNIELFVGTVGIRNNSIFQNFFIGLRPQSEWNKIYIDLSEEVASSQLDAYRIILGAQLVSDTIETGFIFVDNIKLLHF